MKADEFVFPQDRPDGPAGLARAGGLTKAELAAMLIYALNPGSARGAVTAARALMKEFDRAEPDPNHSGRAMGKRG